MSVKPEDFMASGRRLMAQGERNHADQEIDRRNGASRYCYGVFHACSRLATHLGYARVAKSRSSHRDLANFLIDFRDSGKGLDQDKREAVEQVGRQFHSMRNRRVKADYRIDEPYAKKDVRAITVPAEKIFRVLQQIHQTLEDANANT